MLDHPPPPMRRRVIVSLVIVVLALGGGHLILEKLKSMAEAPEQIAGRAPLPVVRVASVVLSDHQESLRGYGVARSLRAARVSAEVGGIVREVSSKVEVGAWVAPPPGTNGSDPVPEDAPPLIRIDRQDLDDALALLHAQRGTARAERERTAADVKNMDAQLEVSARRLRTARTELARILTLVPDTLPESDADRQRLAVFALEQMEAELVSRRDQTNASLAVFDARLEAIDVQEHKALRDLERTRVYAPFRGTITTRHVTLGALVAPGAPLFDLVDPTRVEVQVALPASRYTHVRASREGSAGSRVTLRLDDGGPPIWSGPIIRIDPQVDPATRTFRVYVAIETEGEAAPIPVGGHVVADVEGALRSGVMAVPREAFAGGSIYIVEETGEDDVWVARERQPVVRALLADTALVEPRDGENTLNSGDKVVITSLEDVADGSRLKVILPDAGD